MTGRSVLLSRLPSLPTAAVEILRIFGQDDVSMQEISDLVQTDPALAGKVLRAANSPRFSLAREVSDLRQALSLLGRGKVTPIVLSFTLASESVEAGQHADLYRQFWLRSFVRATAGELLGERFGPAFAGKCFTMNLLAGIGQLALLKQETEQYLSCVDLAKHTDASLEETEISVFGLTHIELSAAIMDESGLPKRLVDAVRYLSNMQPDNMSREAVRLGKVAAIAEAFAGYLCDDDRGVALVVLKERLAAEEYAGISLESLTADVRLILDQSAELFDIDPSGIPDPETILEDAVEQLAGFVERMNSPESHKVPSELITENGRLKEQVKALVQQASTDSLTKVANRSYFDRRLTQLTQSCLRSRMSFGVAVVDIDHFKQVNDTYGHKAGDAVLHQVAQCLQIQTRTNETLARYGGEEFAVLLEEVTYSGLSIVGERLRSAVESLVVEFEDLVIPVTVSVGIACGLPSDEQFGERLFKAADAALYCAKQNGRNRVAVADRELHVVKQ